MAQNIAYQTIVELKSY